MIFSTGRAERPAGVGEDENNTRFANSLANFKVTNSNQNAIAKLKRYQLNYEMRILKLIDQCEKESQLKLSNFKECEELAKNLGRLSNRWKRLTSLVIESLLELDHEAAAEKEELTQFEAKQKKLNKLIQKNEEELNNMSNLSALLSHFIHKAENHQIPNL